MFFKRRNLMQKLAPQVSTLPHTERPTMSVADAASLIGISKPVMYNITERADCDFLIRVGRKKIIHRTRFLSWLDAQAANGKVVYA
jgi:hypothetical protein